MVSCRRFDGARDFQPVTGQLQFYVLPLKVGLTRETGVLWLALRLANGASLLRL